MRVLFIEVDTEQTWAVAALGPAFIAGVLRAHGHEVVSFRIPPDASPADVVAQVKAADPGLLGVSLTSRQWLRARELVGAIRAELTGLPVIAGGLHPTFAPEGVLASPGFDYVCLGEGELATLDLVEALERGEPGCGIPNVWVRGGERPPLRPPFEPIDDMPFMARDLLDEYHGCFHITTQRGCPFPCTYCGARKFHDLYAGVGSYGRRRSHENVLAELRGLRAQGLSYVIFLDDTFTIHHPWVKQFCRVYGDELGLPFSLHARVETVNERMIHMLAEAGCKHITYGVESGSYWLRRHVMKRPVKNERFKDVFRWTREAGIIATANFMLGLPDETRAMMQESLDLAEELDPFDFFYFVFYPYPGTALFQHCRQEGYLPDDYLNRPANHRQSILTLPTISQDDIDEFYAKWTALREKMALARSAAAGEPASARDAIAAQVRQTAAQG